jgi:hypothetical protein
VAGGNPQMLLVVSSRFFAAHRSRIAELASATASPPLFSLSAYTRAGGLMSPLSVHTIRRLRLSSITRAPFLNVMAALGHRSQAALKVANAT